MMTSSSMTCQKIRIAGGAPAESLPDMLAVEEPLEIRVKGHSVAVTMRTPGHDGELATGFLIAEGLLTRAGQIAQIEHCQQGEAAHTRNILNVFLTPDTHFDPDKLRRNFYASSSCGICGKASIEGVHAPLSARCHRAPRQIARGSLLLPGKLRAAQEVFERTGSLHAAGLFDFTGKLLALREDVGRHNAVDKIIGYAAAGQLLPLNEHILFVSGRTSFEIVQKALAAGIPVIAAVSGPSSLAVALAHDSGQTLIGFLRDQTFNIYSGESRIV
ncbi:formate dehydrogenase accessory sulfurtransferase FdhD [Oscillatoria laete-virens NRMC-F 0139]|nr:formate dehydrogenase accessory sulfurtransferase FdhD [Oscillatoria laete-virens]MDL5054513.1 formate dehydrogenase accessory sulfurtransferase FdhD [Oscillatoria laete-virens NRMC-F 0139]